jgi:hypothetical protein
VEKPPPFVFEARLSVLAAQSRNKRKAEHGDGCHKQNDPHDTLPFDYAPRSYAHDLGGTEALQQKSRHCDIFALIGGAPCLRRLRLDG